MVVASPGRITSVSDLTDHQINLYSQEDEFKLSRNDKKRRHNNQHLRPVTLRTTKRNRSAKKARNMVTMSLAKRASRAQPRSSAPLPAMQVLEKLHLGEEEVGNPLIPMEILGWQGKTSNSDDERALRHFRFAHILATAPSEP